MNAKSGSKKMLILIKHRRLPEAANQQDPKQNVTEDRTADQSSSY